MTISYSEMTLVPNGAPANVDGGSAGGTGASVIDGGTASAAPSYVIDGGNAGS